VVLPAEAKVTVDVLREKLTRDICYDFRAVRHWVMLRTWTIFEEERVPFREAVRRGWADVKAVCAEKAAYI